jgi:prepilin-type N-terminal cleavage/methylation domain-containing protein
MNDSRSGGFTLVEMLVSVALFAIVMLMVSAAYLVIIAANRQAQAVASASDNLAFALENMTREIRTGQDYSCGDSTGKNCPSSPRTSFYFIDSRHYYVSYGLSGSTLSECVSQSDFCVPATPLTDASVTVTALNFYLQGNRPWNNGRGDTLQPQVVILLSGTVSAGAGKTVPFNIETGATMRGTDL